MHACTHAFMHTHTHCSDIWTDLNRIMQSLADLMVCFWQWSGAPPTCRVYVVGSWGGGGGGGGEEEEGGGERGGGGSWRERIGCTLSLADMMPWGLLLWQSPVPVGGNGLSHGCYSTSLDSFPCPCSPLQNSPPTPTSTPIEWTVPPVPGILAEHHFCQSWMEWWGLGLGLNVFFLYRIRLEIAWQFMRRIASNDATLFPTPSSHIT